jgi:hypothetical protein
MAKEPEYEYIGPDPVKWIERLMEVNEGSSFSKSQKALIDRRLDTLLRDVECLD